jgi:hypothetical protein
MVEELRHTYDKRKKLLEDRLKNALHSKNELLRNIDIVNEQSKALRLIKNDSNKSIYTLDEAQEQLNSLKF